jgi:hypothetical protein
MTKEDGGDYSWFAGDDYSALWTVGLCLTFVSGRTPDQIKETLYSSLGAPTARVDNVMQLFTVQIYDTAGGSIMMERGGYAGVMHKVVSELSRGTKLITVLRGFQGDPRFVYAVNGEVVTAFDIHEPDLRTGTSPDILLDELTAAGLLPVNEENAWGNDEDDDEEDYDRDWSGEVMRALSVAVAVTGIRFGEEHLEESPHAISLAHLYTLESDVPKRLA